MPQPKKPAVKSAKPVAKKAAQKIDNTRVSKVIKQPGVGPNYSEFNKHGDKGAFMYTTKKPDAKDSAEYKLGYKVGASNARKGKPESDIKKNNPAHYPFRGMGSSFIQKLLGTNVETARYAEGRLEGEKRGKKK